MFRPPVRPARAVRTDMGPAAPGEFQGPMRVPVSGRQTRSVEPSRQNTAESNQSEARGYGPSSWQWNAAQKMSPRSASGGAYTR